MLYVFKQFISRLKCTCSKVAEEISQNDEKGKQKKSKGGVEPETKIFHRRES